MSKVAEYYGAFHYRPIHRGNPYRKKGRFASADDCDTVLYETSPKDTGYGWVNEGQNEQFSFATEEDLKQEQIRKQQEQARQAAENERISQESFQEMKRKRKQAEKEEAQAKIRGKINKLQKILQDKSASEYDKQSARKQIRVLQQKLD